MTAGPAVLQRRHLGVPTAELGVEALADRLAVAHEHRADQRVRADPAAAALGQLERPSEVDPILLCDGGWHLKLIVGRLRPHLGPAATD